MFMHHNYSGGDVHMIDVKFMKWYSFKQLTGNSVGKIISLGSEGSEILNSQYL